MAERNTSELYESIQANIREIVVNHLKNSAVSLSSYHGKRTGNAYQPVRLGDEVTHGFRSAQRGVFAGIDLRNKSVLDLGSNLGEVARDAARAGAASVVGIEYDKYFVQMARLIAVHEDMSNVSFVQGDLTQTEVYRGQYDVVVALSVFTYVRRHVAQLAAMTNEVLIVETHAVKDNWRQVYLESIRKHFPYVALVGMSDHKASSKADWRYLLFCSHKPLDGILAKRARDLASSEGLLTLDMSRSTVAHLDRVCAEIGVAPGNFEQVCAAAKAHLQGRPAEETFEQIGKMGLVASPLYWCHFLVGYDEYRAATRMDDNNSYYRMMAQLVGRGMYDGGFRSSVQRPDRGIPRLAMRYTAIDAMLERGDGGASLDPVILYDILGSEHFPPRGPAFQFFIREIGETVCPVALDGHHRTFAGYCAGARRLRALPMWYEDLKSVLGFMSRNPGAKDALWAGIYGFSERLMAGPAETAEQAQHSAAAAD